MYKQKYALTTDRTKWAAFTPERRKSVYGVMTAILTLGFAYGAWTAETVEQWAKVIDQLLGAVAMFLATIHTGGIYEAPVYGDKDE